MPDEFAWPWALLALPLPWLAQRLLPAARRIGHAALRVPYAQQLSMLHAPGPARGALRWMGVVPLLAWAALCIAAARPQQLGEAVQPPRTGRDLVLAVDLSGSMQQQDMRLGGQTVDRLTAIKAVLDDFLDRRRGDRVGLIVFGSQAYAVTPLTFDLRSVKQQLDDSVVGLAGQETAIGDAIALAVKRMRAQPSDALSTPTPVNNDSKVLIVLTDGVSNAGAVPPLKAAELATAEHIRIHTIGFGGDGDDDMSALFGMAMSMPGMGSDIDEQTLSAIATQTGGRYFRARDTDALAQIYAELDRLEPVQQVGQLERPRTELYPWPLAASLLLIGIGLLSTRRFA